jgi:Uma2 family endonuclease
MTVAAIPTDAVPVGGLTIADIEEMDDIGHNVELIGGSLFVSARPGQWHTMHMLNLWRVLAEQAPPEFRVTAEQGVRVDDGTRPEPDVLVVRADAATDPDASTYEGRDVVLAVEIVSPSSIRMDRKIKPGLYAEAGVRWYWRVEREGDTAVVHTFELDDATEQYVATGIHRGTLIVPVPWAITVDLARLYP